MAAPPTLLRALAAAGGIVLLAEVGGRPVGFAYGFTGWGGGGFPYHRSHAAGLLAPVRGQGLGKALKLAQRREALRRGLERMVWTFDPTQAGNAHFNLHSLGAVGRRFERNYYGSREDALNQDGPTDRVVVEWFLRPTEQRHLERARGAEAGVFVELPPAAAGLSRPRQPGRRRLRSQLEAGFAAGLEIVDFERSSNRYRFAQLPAGFPAAAEGGSVPPSSASRSARAPNTSSSLP
ncbi:MAG: GNAT family N-acetyltransferase [Candidatus Dormibacteria bacterium]